MEKAGKREKINRLKQREGEIRIIIESEGTEKKMLYDTSVHVMEFHLQYSNL